MQKIDIESAEKEFLSELLSDPHAVADFMEYVARERQGKDAERIEKERLTAKIRAAREAGISDAVVVATALGLSTNYVNRLARAAGIEFGVKAHTFAPEPQKRTGRPRTQPLVCTVADCTNKATGKGLCNAHGIRMRVHGDVMAHIPLQRKKKTVNS